MERDLTDWMFALWALLLDRVKKQKLFCSQIYTVFPSWLLLSRNPGVCAGREPPVALRCWEVMTAVVSCCLGTAWLATQLPLVSSPGHSCPGTQGVKGHGHQSWVPAASWDGLLWTQCPSGGLHQQLLLQTRGWSCHLQHSPHFRDFEVQWVVDVPVSCETHLSGLSVPAGISAACRSCPHFSSNIN